MPRNQALYRRALIHRLKNAYTLNGIPWDEALVCMSDASLESNARHWEERAQERLPSGRATITRNPNAGRATAADARYHGETID